MLFRRFQLRLFRFRKPQFQELLGLFLGSATDDLRAQSSNLHQVLAQVQRL